MIGKAIGDIRVVLEVPRLRVQVASDAIPLGCARARELARELNAYADLLDAIGSKAGDDDPWTDGDGYPEANPPGGLVAVLDRVRASLPAAPAPFVDPVSGLRLEDRIRGELNRTSAENASNTPDFILARYLIDCLNAFDVATRARTQWYAVDRANSGPEGTEA